MHINMIEYDMEHTLAIDSLYKRSLEVSWFWIWISSYYPFLNFSGAALFSEGFGWPRPARATEKALAPNRQPGANLDGMLAIRFL